MFHFHKSFLKTYSSAAAVLLALLYAVPSLGYPFGSDQATFFYIGREWLDGMLPYRDAFDHKPPGIFFVHVVAIVLFGVRQVSIRILDIFAILLMGRLIAISVCSDRLYRCELTGAFTLLVSGYYFTCFTYWDTAQVEIWESLFMLGAYAAARSVRSLSRAAIMSGILTATAIIFKLPAVVMALLPLSIVGWRGWHMGGEDKSKCFIMSVRAAGLYLSGILLTICIVCAYFIVSGGGRELCNSLITFNYYYALNSPTDFSLAKWWCFSFWIKQNSIWLPVFIAAWIFGVRSAIKQADGAAVAGAFQALTMTLLAIVSVVIQRKYFAYHWAVVMPFLVLCFGYGAVEILKRFRSTLFIGVLCIVGASFLFAPSWKLTQQGTYKMYTCRLWKYVKGDCSKAELFELFKNPFGSSYNEQEQVGNIVKKRSKEGDRLLVWSYDTAIYEVSGLSAPSRLFWLLPHLRKVNQEWYRNYLIEFTYNWILPPRFVVTWKEDKAAVGFLLDKGYYAVGCFGHSMLFDLRDAK